MHNIKHNVISNRLHSLCVNPHARKSACVFAEDQSDHWQQNTSASQVCRLAAQPVQPLSNSDGTEAKAPQEADGDMQTAQSCSAQLCDYHEV